MEVVSGRRNQSLSVAGKEGPAGSRWGGKRQAWGSGEPMSHQTSSWGRGALEGLYLGGQQGPPSIT